MWILAVLVLLIVAGVAILWPYLRPQSTAIPRADIDPRLIELYTQRDRLYRSVRDARLDMETGKLSQADYEQQTVLLKQQAADVLRKIDTVEQDLLSPQMDAKLEAEIAAMRESVDGRASVGDEVEAAIAAARRRNGGAPAPTPGSDPGAPGRGDRFCGHCGGVLQVGDRFCGKCGQAIRAG